LILLINSQRLYPIFELIDKPRLGLSILGDNFQEAS
jgi:hypothetical protein